MLAMRRNTAFRDSKYDSKRYNRYSIKPTVKLKLLDYYSGPDLDLRRVSLCEAVAGKIAHCFVEWCSLWRRVGLWILIWIFLYQSKDESYNKFWLSQKFNYFKVRLLLRSIFRTWPISKRDFYAKSLTAYDGWLLCVGFLLLNFYIFYSRKITRFLPRLTHIRLKKDLSVWKSFLQFA